MADGGKVLDGTCTSRQWEEADPKVCVFPVGAFEQHSCHLPLAADDIEADYFGRFVAEELGAALLPTLNYGTSLEHSGFKGTISLKPETLMQIVRDVVAEVEGQGFETMIIVNGHGGNFALIPVVRDINRQDRKLKIILANGYGLVDEGILECRDQGRPDIHAGEYETSLMLALRPDLVGPERLDLEPAVEGFRQPDLSTFGVGYVAPAGAFGYPSMASREKGERILASLKRNLIALIRQRLAWLEQKRNYSGKERKPT